MRAILIDTKNKTVEEIDVRGIDLSLYTDCEYVVQVRVLPSMANEVLWIDDDGLLKKDKLPGAFMLLNRAYAGNGLITGLNEYGKLKDTDIPLDQIRSWIKFVPIDILPDPKHFISYIQK